MEGPKLFDYQVDALKRMKNGCILNGDVGSGKSRTGVGYYYVLNGGKINTNNYIRMIQPCDLYIITTAGKRDKGEWETDLAPYGLSIYPDKNIYSNKVTVDSWNNIDKYIDVERCFFIFDEQRVVGYGKWTKSFLAIVKKNRWILLSATPGDCWMDYVPVFIANGFFKNKTDFTNKHVMWSRFTSYPSVSGYINEGRLQSMKNYILIDMDFARKTVPHKIVKRCDFDRELYRTIEKTRWNPFKDKPIENAGEYCLCLRRVVNSSIDRQLVTLDIVKEHPRCIIFYSHDYELEILRELFKDYPCSEWNGHKHQPIAPGDRWVYLVEYTAGCEGWNCIRTDTIIFYSQTYSYKVQHQASGRINRLNTPYIDLYYYHLISESKIDKSIGDALKRKKKFNERRFAPVFVVDKNTKLEEVK